MIGSITMGAAAGVGLALACAAVGRVHWRRATRRTVDRMVALSSRTAAAEGDLEHRREELRGLPAPVRRYFEFALGPRQPRVRVARLYQSGTFATRRDAWAPFRATEVFTVSPPGFVWDARIRMAPLVGVHVRDSLLDGVGTMHGEVAALVPVVDQTGTPEMAAGTLLRYLAETPWLPTALLPEAGVHWSPIEAQTARATLEHGGTTVSMEVHFGAQGEISRITANRFRDVDGKAVLTPWEGRYFDYVVRDGMRVPGRAEVGWHLEDGWFPYWRGAIERFEFEPTAA